MPQVKRNRISVKNERALVWVSSQSRRIGDKNLHVVPPSLVLCFKRIIMFMHIFGFPVFVEDFCRRRIVFTRIPYVFKIIIFFLYPFYICTEVIHGRYAVTAVVTMHFILILGSTWIVHRRRKEVQRILRTMFRYLSPNGRDFLAKQDRKWCYRVIFSMFASIATYLVYLWIRMQSSDTFLDNQYSPVKTKSITSKAIAQEALLGEYR